MEVNLGLLVMNFFLWMGPPFFSRGFFRFYLLLVGFLFSGSYWIYIVFIYFTGKFDGIIVSEFLNESLLCSAIAAISFYCGLYVIVKKNARISLAKSFGLRDVSLSIPSFIVISLFAVIFCFQIYSYLNAIELMGIGDRVVFLDSIKPFWFFYLIPLNMVLLGLISFDSRIFSGENYYTFIYWILLFLHIGIVGFDGSRRASLIPIILVFIKLFLISMRNEPSRSIIKHALLLLLLVFCSQLFTLNRAFDVGWGILFVDLELALSYIPIFFELSLSPMPTVHVNTQMLELINIEGAHGYMSYLKAIGNTLFPQFIFGFYMFGEPLVSELHQRFNWYGQDFGFMAEAIYSGGRFGVFLAHFFLGGLLGFMANRVTKSRLRVLFMILLFSFLFGLVNSLRSDFMNLLKTFLYPGFFLYFLSRVFAMKRPRLVNNIRQHREKSK
ncbi:O-antigen polymerase [Candidatus Njordibacter sp. Uisw_002]|uniref:O-antigen polymerase n=1 Tax=Candidatus Njordibacter sp. Uisw_002 TaxID=3230971 RepID=UPI003D3DCF37